MLTHFQHQKTDIKMNTGLKLTIEFTTIFLTLPILPALSGISLIVVILSNIARVKNDIVNKEYERSWKLYFKSIFTKNKNKPI